MGVCGFHGVLYRYLCLTCVGKNAIICVIKNVMVKSMIKDTYIKCYRLSQKYNGYISTSELLREGLTNRQISEFVANGMLEKVCHGIYWFSCADYAKSGDYKAIEICRSNPRAVICADSACFYQGLIDVEPPVVSVATRRDDRSKIAMNFPVTRHYYSGSSFSANQKTINTDFGQYKVYDIERSVCDCIRFKDTINDDIFCLVIERYKEYDEHDKAKGRMVHYAKKLHMLNQLTKYI